MSLIKQFPIDTIKIDRSSVRDLPKDSEDQAIAQAIHQHGQGAEMTIVAEGGFGRFCNILHERAVPKTIVRDQRLR